jgi:hypothetical protein
MMNFWANSGHSAGSFRPMFRLFPLAALTAVLFTPSICTATIAQVATNGGFETGNFSGWSVTNLDEGGPSTCGTDWHVRNSGITGCQAVDNPILGSFEANNSFDGTGPKTYRVSETFNVPGVVINSAILSWSDTSYVYVGCCGGGTQSREFYVDLTAELTNKIYSQMFADNCGPTHPSCTPEVHHWTSHSVDITSFLNSRTGQNVTFGFNNFVPNVYTGSAGFGLDGVSLVIDYSSAPEPASAEMFLIAIAMVCAGWRWTVRRPSA